MHHPLLLSAEDWTGADRSGAAAFAILIGADAAGRFNKKTIDLKDRRRESVGAPSSAISSDLSIFRTKWRF